MRTRLRRRRERARDIAPRGTFCEDRMYSGPYFGARCIYLATGYQPRNDIYVCGIHARAYLNVEPVAVSA